MKNLRTAKASWKQIRRSPYQALAAICIMMLTFLAISIFSFIVFGSSMVIDYFESRPLVRAFYEEEVVPTDQEVSALKASLMQTGKVEKVTYVSKPEALEIYKQQNKNDPQLIELVSQDWLPASVEISTYNVEDLGAIAQILKNTPNIKEVIYQEDVVERLTQWTSTIRIIGITVIIVLALVSIIIMMTVIGFKVSQKREEIEIMRLLSATNWYIRWPFILEGIFYGVVGTVLGWIVASAVLLYASPYLEAILRGIPLLPISPVFLLQLLLAELFVAVMLGMLASSLAVLRYLK